MGSEKFTVENIYIACRFAHQALRGARSSLVVGLVVGLLGLSLLIDHEVSNTIFAGGEFLVCCALRGFHSSHVACTAALVFGVSLACGV